MNKIQMKCTACDGVMEVDEGKSILQCPYCGAKELIAESDAVKIEMVKAETAKEIEKARLAHEAEKENRAEKKAKEEEVNASRSKFAKSWIGIAILVLAVVCIILTFTCFKNGHILAGLVALVQTALFVFSWIVGMSYVKQIKSGFYILGVVLGLVLFIPYANFVSASEKNQETGVKYDWPNSGIVTMLEKPDSKYGKIHEYGDSANVDVYRADKEEYKEYVEKLKNKGFTENSSESDGLYDAYNSEGYEVRVIYYDSKNEFSINISAPEEMKKLTWPTNGAAALIDEPDYTGYGEITTEESNALNVTVYINGADAFEDYIKKCQDRGYIVDYSKTSTRYSANDAEGNELHLEYISGRNDKMRISISKPVEKTESKPAEDKNTSENKPVESTPSNNTEANKPAENTESKPANGLRPEFKKAMDDYEAFYDEYVAFMNKYVQNPADPTLLLDYGKMMTKVQQMDESFGKWDSTNTSEAEWAYYLQVQQRITQKTINVF